MSLVLKSGWRHSRATCQVVVVIARVEFIIDTWPYDFSSVFKSAISSSEEAVKIA